MADVYTVTFKAGYHDTDRGADVVQATKVVAHTSTEAAAQFRADFPNVIILSIARDPLDSHS